MVLEYFHLVFFITVFGFVGLFFIWIVDILLTTKAKMTFGVWVILVIGCIVPIVIGMIQLASLGELI